MQQFEFDGYRCRRVLGEGATGDVYLADKDGEQVAIKVLDREAQGAMYPALHKNMQKEIDALNRVGTHSYIMKIVGYGFDVNWTKDNTTRTGDYIATEVVPNGELFDYVDNPMGGISEGVAKQLLL
jgi:serine/threonine protein kinase